MYTLKAPIAILLELAHFKISKEDVNHIDSDFMCEIKDIKRLIPSDLNMDFFKKAFPDKDIKTEKELRVAIKKELSAKYCQDSDRKFFNDVTAIFLEKVKIDFPDLFLKKWLKQNVKKEFSESEFEIEYVNYRKYLSWQLIEKKIRFDNNININNDQLKEFTKSHVIQQMKSYGGINMGNKEIDGIVTNILKNPKESDKMMNELVLIELVQYFKSKMKITKKSISLNEFIKLANNQK